MIEKDCFSAREAPVVQFSKLDENNKAQFLQFLIRNNITFDNSSGKQNLTAKITLAPLKRPKSNNKMTLSKNINKINKQEAFKNSNDQLSREKIRDKNKQNDSHHFYNKQIKNKSKTPLKLKLNQNLQIKSKDTKSKDNPNKKKLRNNSFIKIDPNPSIIISSFRQNNWQKQDPVSNIFNLSKSQKSNNNLSKENKIKQRTKEDKLKQNKLNASKRKSCAQSFHNDDKKPKCMQKNFQLISPLKSESKVMKEFQQKGGVSLENKSNKKNVQSSPFIKQLKLKHNFEDTKRRLSKQSIANKNSSDFNLSKKQNKQCKNSSQNTQTLNFNFINKSRQQLLNESLNKSSLYQSQDRLLLANKYKKYFHILQSHQTTNNFKVARQRPVCWPLNQVEKFLDQFYDDNFAKNTHQILNGNKKLNDSLFKSNNQKSISHIALSLQKFIEKKFNKIQKSIEYNLINFIYSVAFYVYQFKQDQEQENSSIISLTLFEDFLMQRKNLQDYLFFLFSRNIIKTDFKKSFIATNIKCLINKKQIDRFLKHIIGKRNSQILEEYHKMIFQKIEGYQIEINKLMKILVDDFKNKRESAQQSFGYKQKRQNYDSQKDKYYQSGSFQNDSKNQLIYGHSYIGKQNEESELQNTFHKILNLGNRNEGRNNIFEYEQSTVNEQQFESVDQLTFGQDTKDLQKQIIYENLQINEQENEKKQNVGFWKSMYMSKSNQSIYQERFIKDEFNQMIVQRLYQKTKQLIELLSNNINDQIQTIPDTSNQQMLSQCNPSSHYDHQNYKRLQQMLFIKSLSLFMTVIEMNKVKWLKQLKIQTPSQQDIQIVEEIQLLYRKIKEYPVAKDIAQFCKMILTLKQITQQLSQFFV